MRKDPISARQRFFLFALGAGFMCGVMGGALANSVWIGVLYGAGLSALALRLAFKRPKWAQGDDD